MVLVVLLNHGLQDSSFDWFLLILMKQFQTCMIFHILSEVMKQEGLNVMRSSIKPCWMTSEQDMMNECLENGNLSGNPLLRFSHTVQSDQEVQDSSFITNHRKWYGKTIFWNIWSRSGSQHSFCLHSPSFFQAFRLFKASKTHEQRGSWSAWTMNESVSFSTMIWVRMI